MFISMWECLEVLGFWCGYVLPISVLDLLELITELGTTDPSMLTSLHLLPLTILFYLLRCPLAYSVSVSFVSLCLGGSVLQYSDFSFACHLPSILSIVYVVPNFVLSPFPFVFNGVTSDFTVHLISQAGKHQAIVDLFSPTSSWFSMKVCLFSTYLHPHLIASMPGLVYSNILDSYTRILFFI